MLRKAKLLLALGSVAAAFAAGWMAQGWRLNEKQARYELAMQESVRSAMIAQATYIERVNTESAARETDLLEAQDADREFIQELRDAIETRPIITEVVERPIVIDGVAECPAVPVINWLLFQDAYNAAATGAPVADPAGGSDALVRPSTVADAGP